MTKTKSAVELVYHHLVENILSGRYAPGERLERRRLAAELGVSYSPVGEAVLQLELEGLLTTRPRKGTFVTAMDDEFIQEQIIARLAVECQAARMYCGEKLRQHRDRLRAMADELEKTPHGTLEHAVRDTRFHRELVRLSGSSSLLQMFDLIMRKGLLLAAFVRRGDHSDPGDDVDHLRLLELLETGEPDLAEFIIRSNLLHGKILDGIKSGAATGLLARERGAVDASPARQRLESSMSGILQ